MSCLVERRVSALSVFISLTFAAVGCAVPLEEAQVTSLFRERVSCANTSVMAEAGGYVVVGCNTAVHYRCFDDDSGQSFGLGEDTCVEDQVEDHSAVAQTREDMRVGSQPSAALGVVVRGSSRLLPHGRIVALGAPDKQPGRVVLALRTLDKLTLGDCQSHLFRDGDALPVISAKAVAAYEARVEVSPAVLQGLQNAERFAGDVCGLPFELDEAGRHMLSEFEMRFREELQKHAASPLQNTPQTSTP